MNITDIERVTKLAEERERIIGLLEDAPKGILAVTIGSHEIKLTPAFRATLGGLITRDCTEQLAEIEAQLEALGVNA